MKTEMTIEEAREAAKVLLRGVLSNTLAPGKEVTEEALQQTVENVHAYMEEVVNGVVSLAHHDFVSDLLKKLTDQVKEEEK